MKHPKEYPYEMNKRNVDWLNKQKDSQGKRIAREVAGTLDTIGEHAAIEEFRIKTKDMLRWEQVAIADMVAAYRAKFYLEESGVCISEQTS